MKKHTLVVGIIVLFVCGVVLWKILREPHVDESVLLPLQTSEDAVYVADQRPGYAMVGTLAVLSRPGFLVVHRDKDGGIGGVMGATALLPVGRNEHVDLTLDRKASDGEALYALLYEDTDGDNIFTDGTDQPLLDSAGSKVFMMFSVTKR